MENNNENYMFISNEEMNKLIYDENKRIKDPVGNNKKSNSADEVSKDQIINSYLSYSDNLEDEEEESNDSNIQEKQMLCEFFQAVKDDNIAFLEQFCSIESNIKYLNYCDCEGILPIHYAVLFGNINSIKFLVEKGVEINQELEGLPILHLSLSFSVLNSWRDISINSYFYILDNYSKLKKLHDRLGRTILHIVFQYDLFECLQVRENTYLLEDFLTKEISMETPIDYLAIYNSHLSFNKLCEIHEENFIGHLIFYDENRFFEKVLAYKSFDILFVFYNFLIDKFEKLIQIRTQIKLLEMENPNIIEGYGFIFNKQSESEDLLNFKSKIKNIYDLLKKVQKFFSEKLILWRKFDHFKESFPNDNEQDENIEEFKTIHRFFSDYSNLINQFKLYYENYFKINPDNDDSENTIIMNDMLNDCSIFNELKFNSECFFDDLKNSFKNFYSSFISQFQKKKKKTLLVYNNKCLKHCDFSNLDPITRVNKRGYLVENPDRLNVLFEPPFGIFLSEYFNKNFNFIESSKPGCLADITKVHDFDYIMKIKTMCEETARNGNTQIMKYDKDTSYSMASYDAAIQAVGCVIDAIDEVINKKAKNAFVAIRPPGHHAGYFGKVQSNVKKDDSCSNGFCFFNNVAIGASYAISRYRHEIKKVAIVDFDVHHGNGTEDIIKNLKENSFNLISQTELDGGIKISINQTICKPWLDFNDPENVLFVSLHAYDMECPAMFYPSSGGGETNTIRGIKPYPAGILNIPIYGENKYSPEYKQMFINKVIPRLNKFKPDLILISAGFDGHELEEMNVKYMKLNENDYRFMTEELSKIANKYSKGRIISVLEGGYNINSGIISSFAQSVMTHVKFLNIAGNKFYFDENKFEENENPNLHNYNLSRLKAKRKRDFHVDQMNYRNLRMIKNENMNAHNEKIIADIDKNIEKQKENEKIEVENFINVETISNDLIKRKNQGFNKDFPITALNKEEIKENSDINHLHKEENTLNPYSLCGIESAQLIMNPNLLNNLNHIMNNSNFSHFYNRNSIENENQMFSNIMNNIKKLNSDEDEDLELKNIKEKTESEKIIDNKLNNFNNIDNIEEFYSIDTNIHSKQTGEIETNKTNNIDEKINLFENSKYLDKPLDKDKNKNDIDNSMVPEEEIMVEFDDEEQ